MKSIAIVLSFFLMYEGVSGQGSNRQRLLMDFNWRFAFGHPFDPQKDFGTGTGYFSYLAKAGYGDGAAAYSFDDRSWRRLDLPHDWAVEQPFHPTASFSHGFKAIGRNFPGASVGWYRKHFTIPLSDTNKKISIVFDGVFRNSIVWVNGHYLGTEESGYAEFSYDISDVIHYGEDNVVAVRVDATMEEGWFYEGAGIYRHVWLTKTAPVHIPMNGTFVHSKVEPDHAVLTVQARITNEDRRPVIVTIRHTVADTTGSIVSSRDEAGIRLLPFETKENQATLSVSHPHLWDLDSPYLYQLVTTVLEGPVVLDQYETSFGIRTIRFDARKGFLLNGKAVKLKGTNNHQDHAGVGAALPDQLQYWRIKTLKDIGSNAYRCSHNPPAKELLDACDQLGMLVIDENRLMRTSAPGLDDMKKLIERDRNHPSVIAWSIGNEEWAIENNVTGERIAQTLQDFAKSLDSTRSVTAGISGGFQSGISSILEVMGYNYLGNGDIDAHQKRFSHQPGIGTEEGSTFATRGVYVTDNAKHYRAAYDQKPRPSFYSIEEGWKFYESRPHLAGMFIWTGFDYRGEPTPYGWPSVTSYFGMLDLCGFPKDNVYYLRSWWSNRPTLHLFPHWNWKGSEGKPVDVWVYSNCDEVELVLNKKTLGRKKIERNGHLEWKANYAPGILEAIGYKGGKAVLTNRVQTTGEPVAISLATQNTLLNANGEDISVIMVNAIDRNGLPVPVAGNEISFKLDGPGSIIGVGNGDPTSLETERFIEKIVHIPIVGLREKAVESMDAFVIESEMNDSSWKEAFRFRDYKNLAKAYATYGTFTLPGNLDSGSITLFYKNIGVDQSIYINGTPIAVKLTQGETTRGFVLDRKVLKTGRNTIAILATPIPKRNEWDYVNTDPGVIQIMIAPQPWKRKLFNGLAQIIVQSKKEAGPITLTATGTGIRPAILRLTSLPVTSRASVD